MSEYDNIKDQDLDKVSGGTTKTGTRIKARCPYCLSTEHVCSVRNIRRGKTVERVYYCTACDKEFRV